MAQLGPCTRALLLDASDELLEERQRAADGSAQSAEMAQRKVRTYRNQTMPAIDALQSRGVISTVDASGTADETFSKLSAAYQRYGLS